MNNIIQSAETRKASLPTTEFSQQKHEKNHQEQQYSVSRNTKRITTNNRIQSEETRKASLLTTEFSQQKH